jgi:RNA polymerase sigma-70 factor (ECF subfamily)
MMNTKPTLADTVLVLRCQLGDEAAFERLVANYSPKVRYYVWRLAGRQHQEEDILQAIWLAVWSQLPKLRNPEAFRAWLYRIARNIALQGLRNRVDHVPLEDDHPAPADAEERFSKEEAAAVHAALDAISPAHKEVLVLRFLEDMSYEEIAEIVGCSVGTVRSRIYYGKKHLRSIMEARGYG